MAGRGGLASDMFSLPSLKRDFTNFYKITKAFCQIKQLNRTHLRVFGFYKSYQWIAYKVTMKIIKEWRRVMGQENIKI